MKYSLPYIAATLFVCCAMQSTFAQGTWRTDSGGLFPRDDFYSGVVNGKLYVIGGNSGRLPIQEFDPLNHTWTTPAFAGVDSNIWEGTSCTVNNKIYIIGGFADTGWNRDLFIVDPIAQTMTRTPTNGQFLLRSYSACAEANGRIYVFGGWVGDHAVDTVEMLDLSTLTWSILQTSGSFTPAAGMTANAVDGKIYVIGGDNQKGTLFDTVQVFDPSSNTWVRPQTTGTFTGRGYHAASVLNGKIYVAGGGSSGFPLEWFSSWSQTSDTTELQIFDPATNSWSIPKFSGTFTSRTKLQSATIDGKLYTFGGYRPHSETNLFEVFTASGSGVRTSATNVASPTLFPNPATSTVTILNLDTSSSVIEIFDELGRSIEVEHVTNATSPVRLDVTHFNTGIYTIRIGNSVAEFVKE